MHEDQSPVPFIIVYLVLPWQTGTITMHPWIPFTGSAPSKVFFASITLSPVEPNIWTRAVIPELCVCVCGRVCRVHTLLLMLNASQIGSGRNVIITAVAAACLLRESGRELIGTT